MHVRRWWIWLAWTVLLRAQGPVVEARGVVNGVTFELAPSTVAPGGIFNVYGFNLAPGAAAASSVPLPTSLGSPAVEVTVNGRLAPLYFVSPTQINAQVPWETESGSAQVTVRRGGVSSRPATLIVRPGVPSLFALNGAGFGPAIAVRAANGRLVGPSNPPAPGDVLTLYASGLGPVDPQVASGVPGPGAFLARVTRPQRASVNGFPADVLFAGLAPGFVGLFQINLQLPDQAAPGDVVQYFSGPEMANRLTLGSLDSARFRFLPLPEGVSNLLGIADSDLNGGFVAINGPRGEDGCYQNVHIVDFRRNQTTRISECLIHGNPNAPTPFIAENETAKLAALIGPAVGMPPSGITSRVLVVDAARGRVTTIDLPAPAAALLPGGLENRGLLASLPGEPARLASINTETGEVQVLPAAVLAGGAGGGLAGAAPGPNVNIDGLTQVVSQVLRLPGNRLALVVADSQSEPQRAIFAVVSATGEASIRIPFPDGYLPLIPPRPSAPGGGAGGPGGGAGGPGRPGGPGPQPAPRASAIGDPQAGRFIVLARSRDGARHALAIFEIERTTGRAADFPSGVFAASCSPNLNLLNLALARKIALPVTDRLESAASNPCAGTGLLVFDPAGTGMTRLALPENGTLDVNSVNLFNDYLYGVNADRLSQNPSSLFVFDGVTNTISKLDTPRGATAFAGLQPIRATGQLLALASNRAPGDEGLILFDVANGSSRLFPVPEGFVRVANPGLQQATRKLTARGLKAGTEGSQVLVFDPASGAVTVLANPPGGQSVGAPATAGAQARMVFERNQNSNTIFTAVYGGGDRPIGLALFEGL